MQNCLRNAFALLIGTLVLAGCVAGPSTHEVEPAKPRDTFQERARQFKAAVKAHAVPFTIPRAAAVDTVLMDSSAGQIRVKMNPMFAGMPFRDSTVTGIYAAVRNFFGEEYRGMAFAVELNGRPIEDLVPNLYRADPSRRDPHRLARPERDRPLPVVRNLSSRNTPSSGLAGRNIVVWPSHGWYYSEERDRWEWQRPRLFQAVEDLIPLSFVLPYLAPMLENAGATVFITRERDTQTNEVVVDNDSRAKPAVGVYRETSRSKRQAWTTVDQPGFSIGTPPYPDTLNPFHHGTSRMVAADSVGIAGASWTPTIPEAGYYAVYVSYASLPASVDDASYTVFHEGGSTQFRVNQRIGGATWEYLGRFRFRAGTHPERGRVVLSSKSTRAGGIVTADAVRFGGGMGVIERHGHASGRPKFVEGSRYYLQYAGMPDSLVYSLSRHTNDYRDDYQSRPEYANFLRGAPFGPNKNRNARGLGIPVDLSFAFHTDAGITQGDSTVGTLSIFSVPDGDGSTVFPDSVSRFANRDLADILQTQIVGDLRASQDPRWSRRDLRDADYSEAFRPNVPSVLLELLSHQNLSDMTFVLDPQFRFDVSRAIYKGILRFLGAQNGVSPVVQPLPVTHFAALLTGEHQVTLRWLPTVDSLEPSALANRYIVYTRVNNGGFDNGVLVNGTTYTRNGIRPGDIYSFQVTAANDGGESFPSEILSVCQSAKKGPTALVVNGFTRVSGPARVETPGFSGFLNQLDSGVPDRIGLNFTGTQYNFNPGAPFLSNDSPGHGASHADREGTIVAGNSFDYPFVHGAALKENGFSFSSAGSDAIMDSLVDLRGYPFVDLILGEQKETHWPSTAMDSIRGTRYKAFPPKLRSQIMAYCAFGGNIFVSGAYLGSDIFARPRPDSAEVSFLNEVLKCTWVADHAAVTGIVAETDSFAVTGKGLRYNTDPSPDLYAVEAPDALGAVPGSRTILRYAENRFSAAVAFKGKYGVITFGFPFEAIVGSETRAAAMRSVVEFLGVKK